MDTQRQLQRLLADFTHHGENAGLGVDHRTAFLRMLQQHFPQHHTVMLDRYASTNFEGFAEDNDAKMILDVADERAIRTRDYRSPDHGRVRKGQGSAGDSVTFGKYNFQWKERSYSVFKFTFVDMYNFPNSVWFISYPLASTTLTAEKNCPEIDELIVAIGSWEACPHEDVHVFEQGRLTRSKGLWKSVKDCKWEDVIMDPAIKSQIMKDAMSFFNPDTKAMYLKYGIPYKRGLLLHGPPGNGKTSLIKALVADLQRLEDPVPTIYVKSLVDKCNGGDHVAVRSVFQNARRMAPCCIILEDLDSLINDPKVRSYFLNEMDGLESNDGLLIVGSTNHLDSIDEAIRSRPSRFDRKYGFELPNRSERELYAKFWYSKLKDTEELDFVEDICPLLADLTENFSYAFMKELYIATLWMAAKKGMGEEVFEWDVVNTKSAEASEVGEEKTEEKAEDKNESKTEEVKTCDKKEERNSKCFFCATCDSHKKSIFKEGMEENKPVKKVVKKNKKEVPAIEVPESLQSNVFLKCAQINVGILLRDMDNRQDPNEDGKASGTASEFELQMRILERINRARSDDDECFDC